MSFEIKKTDVTPPDGYDKKFVGKETDRLVFKNLADDSIVKIACEKIDKPTYDSRIEGLKHSWGYGLCRFSVPIQIGEDYYLLNLGSAAKRLNLSREEIWNKAKEAAQGNPADFEKFLKECSGSTSVEKIALINKDNIEKVRKLAEQAIIHRKDKKLQPDTDYAISYTASQAIQISEKRKNPVKAIDFSEKKPMDLITFLTEGEGKDCTEARYLTTEQLTLILKTLDEKTDANKSIFNKLDTIHCRFATRDVTNFLLLTTLKDELQRRYKHKIEITHDPYEVPRRPH